MSPITPTISEVIGAAVEGARARTWTISVGSVSSVNGDGTVDVDPGIEQPADTAEGATGYEKLPNIPNCRICYLQAGNAAITFKVDVGTTGMLLHPTYSIAEWRQGNGGAAQPADVRTHHLGQALFLPCVVVDSKTATYANDPDMVLEPGTNMIRLGGAASDFVALASKVNHELGSISSALSHLTAPLGGGTVTGNTYVAPGDVSATKVKAE